MRVEDQNAIAQWLSERTDKPVSLANVRILSGGAIQENWAADITVGDETLATVIRCDAPSSVSDSWSRAEEFALLKAAFAAGVTVPGPLWLGEKGRGD